MVRLPIRCMWIATGNNPAFSNEMARRLVRIRLDARVDQPSRRESFRHPDLMGWVRANRGKLVAACLTLCQAWVAAGRPRGSRSIGSFENWAQIISGVLDVAGVNGFLGNLDEMMEASDSEGAVWRSFVETWWGRFGTAEVTTASLYELAFLVEPPLPINAPDEQGRRVKLGKALSKLRDRTFRLATHAVQVKALGVRQQAQRWGLVLSQEKDTPQAHLSTAEPVKSGRIGRIAGGLSEHPPTQNHPSNQYVREDGEDREDVSHPYAYARACMNIKERGESSPSSPSSLDHWDKTILSGEDAREDCHPSSQSSHEPSWLEGMP